MREKKMVNADWKNNPIIQVHPRTPLWVGKLWLVVALSVATGFLGLAILKGIDNTWHEDTGGFTRDGFGKVVKWIFFIMFSMPLFPGVPILVAFQNRINRKLELEDNKAGTSGENVS